MMTDAVAGHGPLASWSAGDRRLAVGALLRRVGAGRRGVGDCRTARRPTGGLRRSPRRRPRRRASVGAQQSAATSLPPLAVAPPVSRQLLAAGAAAGDADCASARGGRSRRRMRHRPATCGASAAPTCCWSSWSPTARSRSIARRWPRRWRQPAPASPPTSPPPGAGRVGDGRFADLRRRVVAGPRQPDDRRGSARRGHQRRADVAAAATRLSRPSRGRAIAPWR